MKFFEEQERARAKSRRLVALFILLLAVLEVGLNGMAYLLMSHGASVQSVQQGLRHEEARLAARPHAQAHGGQGAPALPAWPFMAITISSLGVILISAALKASELREGGGAKVARLSGGVPADPSDPRERRLLNVVEEMSIASGAPLPKVFVMRKETGINAFAAGWSSKDAVVCVTRGCLEALTRDELQGVVAHEFSHIFNADMRLNIQAMSMLFGFYSLSIAGEEIWGLGRFGGDGESRFGLLVLLFGASVIALGWVGRLFGEVLSAALSREREYLADASAVQFTRNPEGIGGALRKIAWTGPNGAVGSKIKEPKARAMAHMFFGSATSIISEDFLPTHPPLAERIERVYGRPMEELRPLEVSAVEDAEEEKSKDKRDGSRCEMSAAEEIEAVRKANERQVGGK